MKIFLLISLLVLVSPSYALTLNCLNEATQKKYVSSCRQVLDLTKFESSRGKDIRYINCLGDLEDGYAHQRCESVELYKQRRLQAKLRLSAQGHL